MLLNLFNPAAIALALLVAAPRGIKKVKEQLTVPEYSYVVFPDSKICFELNNSKGAAMFAEAFDGQMYPYYPYEDFGYEDPYTFTNEWTVYSAENGYTVVRYEEFA